MDMHLNMDNEETVRPVIPAPFAKGTVVYLTKNYHAGYGDLALVFSGARGRVLSTLGSGNIVEFYTGPNTSLVLFVPSAELKL